MTTILPRVVSLCFLLTCCLSGASSFDGAYVTQGQFGEVTLHLNSGDDTTIRGSLSGNGVSFSLQGSVEDGALKGFVEGQPISFNANLMETTLHLTLTELDAAGNPQPGTAQIMVFEKREGLAAAGSNLPEAGKAAVVINGVTLSAEQIAELSRLYKVTPRPGNYWYDSNSGLYGVVGHQAFGFMYPGHEFGQLAREASRGNTQVIVNNRELPQHEWAVWSYILGYWIQPGNYWLDSNGNAGYMGSPIPVVNLYQAATQNGYRGQGGSGDNFWSSRFSAGNSDSGNTRGYVSVPGYGPVGYGF
jgi:hypothetical protein